MEKKAKTSKKIFTALSVLLAILMVMVLVVFVFNIYLSRQEEKQREQEAIEKLPIIEERIQNIIDDNVDIYNIESHFEYDGINFIELYVRDTWFNSTEIEKQRFASDVRASVKSILVEESFINADDRVGIYVYSYDGILLAESSMFDEIKLK